MLSATSPSASTLFFCTFHVQIASCSRLTSPLAPAKRRLLHSMLAIADTTLAFSSCSVSVSVSAPCQPVFQVISPLLLRVQVRLLLRTTVPDLQQTNVHGSLRRSGSSFVSAACIVLAAAVSFLLRARSSRVFNGPA